MGRPGPRAGLAFRLWSLLCRLTMQSLRAVGLDCSAGWPPRALSRLGVCYAVAVLLLTAASTATYAGRMLSSSFECVGGYICLLINGDMLVKSVIMVVCQVGPPKQYSGKTRA